MKPTFLISLLVQLRSPGDHPRLLEMLSAWAARDDTLYVASDDPVAGIVVGAMSEENLGKIVRSLEGSGVALNVGAPQVAYLETISRSVVSDYAHKKMTADGGGQFAYIEIAVDPLERGAGFAVEQAKADLPAPFLAGARAGIDSVLAAGVLLGFPIVDLKVTLLQLTFHETDSSAETFKIAATHALRRALSAAGPVVLEPMMQVRVSTSLDHAEAVVRDLRSRRAVSLERLRQDTSEVVTAFVPLANMIGYANAPVVKLEGTVILLLAFSHYRPLPGDDDPFPMAAAKRA